MASETLTSSEHRELSKIVIKAETFNELLEMIGEYFHFNKGVNFVGGPFKSKIKEQLMQEILSVDLEPMI